MELTATDIKLILATLQESGYDEAEVAVGDVRIAVARGGSRLADLTTLRAAEVPSSPPVPAPSPIAAVATAPPASAVPSAGSGVVITAPSVGVFWRAPEPGAAPYVEVGSVVSVGDTVGIVEVMKLMSNVSTDVAGTVTAIHVENAAGVEFGTPLVTISPAE